MSEDISEKVKALLEDPEMLAKIALIAGGLGSGKSAAPATASSSQYNSSKDTALPEQINNAEQSSIPTAMKPPEIAKPPITQDPRLSLLNSLKPFLREDRRSKVDNLARALSVASLMGNLNKDKK